MEKKELIQLAGASLLVALAAVFLLTASGCGGDTGAVYVSQPHPRPEPQKVEARAALPNGDVDQDGYVTAKDVLLALRYVTGEAEPTQCDIQRADLYPADGGTPQPDGAIDINDVLAIERVSLGLETLNP